MKVDVYTQLREIDGRPLMRIVVGEDPRPILLSDVLIKALLEVVSQQDLVAMSGEEKMKKWRIAERIQDALDDSKAGGTAIVEFDLDEAQMLKKAVGKMYGPAIVGQTWQILEGKTSKILAENEEA